MADGLEHRPAWLRAEKVALRRARNVEPEKGGLVRGQRRRRHYNVI